MSVQSKGRYLDFPDIAERAAIRLLGGVGGEHEWWLAHGAFIHEVSHLRVPVTRAENDEIGPGLVTTDAGEVGIWRPRSVL